MDPQGALSAVTGIDMLKVSKTIYDVLRDPKFELTDAIIKTEHGFDIVVANILAGPLQKLSSELANLLASGGIIVLSGILVKQAEELARCYQPCFDNIELTYKNDWTRLVARKK